MNNIYQYNIFFQAQEFIAMFIDMGDGHGVREVVDETPETFEEAVMLALVIASFYAHPHVHYWSNGVAQLVVFINLATPLDQ